MMPTRTAVVAAALSALLLVPAARAQQAVDPAFPDTAVPRAPVEIDGVVLYEVRGVSASWLTMR